MVGEPSADEQEVASSGGGSAPLHPARLAYPALLLSLLHVLLLASVALAPCHPHLIMPAGRPH